MIALRILARVDFTVHLIIARLRARSCSIRGRTHYLALLAADYDERSLSLSFSSLPHSLSPSLSCGGIAGGTLRVTQSLPPLERCMFIKRSLNRPLIFSVYPSVSFFPFFTFSQGNDKLFRNVRYLYDSRLPSCRVVISFLPSRQEVGGTARSNVSRKESERSLRL